MVTENERKYVLYCDRIIIDQIKSKASKIIDQQQAFLKEGTGWVLRVRKSNTIYCVNNKIPQNPKYTLTFKQKANGRQIEIEQELDDRDYSDLFNTRVGLVYKRRHVIVDGLYEWEIDAYMLHHEDKDPYFILAEVELDENVDSPEHVPSFITDNLLYEVSKDDRGFSSKKLRDPSYARELYNNLLGSDRYEKTRVQPVSF